MKRILFSITCSFFLLALFSCSKTTDSQESELISIPDLSGVSQTSAEELLLNNSLIPVIKYEYNNSVDEGLIIRTDPDAFEEVAIDTRITLYVSKGIWPSIIYSKSSTIHWSNVSGSSGDEYDFYNPEIANGTIQIEINVAYNSSYEIEWIDDDNDGYGFGAASLSADFDNDAYLWIEYETKSIISGVEQTIIIYVDADELRVNEPNVLYIKLYVKLNDESYDIEINFEITW